MSKEVYHPFPRFENSIYRLALKQKEKMLKEETIRRIKRGEFTNLGALHETIRNLSSEEINEIIEYWKNNDLITLKIIYEKSLKTKDISKIMQADRSYFLYTYSKKHGGMKRG